MSFFLTIWFFNWIFSYFLTESSSMTTFLTKFSQEDNYFDKSYLIVHILIKNYH